MQTKKATSVYYLSSQSTMPSHSSFQLIMASSNHLLYFLVGVVGLLLVPNRAGDDHPSTPHDDVDDHPMTEAEVKALEDEMAKEIEKTTKEMGNITLSGREQWYMNLTARGRAVITELDKGRDPERQGRQSGIGEGIETVVQGAVSAAGVVEKLGNTATGLLNGLVNAAKLAFEIAKEVNRMRELKESRSGFMRGILYEVQFQTEEVCNTVVFNLNKEHEKGLTGVTYFKSYNYEGATFGVWVAAGGYFKNKAWFFKEAHWGFGGSYSKAGLFKDKVVFNQRPCYSKPY